jgi:hypothetical protein
VVDVLRLAGAEQRLQERVAPDAVVEDLLEAMEGLFAPSMLVKRWHQRKIESGDRALTVPPWTALADLRANY